MRTKNNIKKFYIYSIFKDALIIGPIITLYLLNKNLSMTEIMTLQAVFSFSIFLLEVPTGAVADRFSRKISLFLGFVFIIIGIITYILGHSFLVFCLAEFLFSVGFSFKSGADSALLYDSLLELGQESDFNKIYGQGQSNVFYVQAIGSIIASLIYTIHPDLPFLLSSIFMICAGITALSFKEVRIKEEDEESLKYFQLIYRSARFILNHRKILGVTIFAMVFYVLFRNAFWYYTPFFKAIDLPVALYGLLFFIFNIVAAFFSKRVDWFIQKTNRKTLIALNVLLMLSFLGLSLLKTPFGVIFILLQQICRGLYKPILNKYVNKHTPSKNRATVLSFISLITNLSVSISLPLAGLLIDNTNVFIAYGTLFIILSLATVVVNQYLNRVLSPPKKALAK